MTKKKKVLTIQEIKDLFYAGAYTSKIQIPKKLQANHVFDEEWSVRKNKEAVAEYNAKVDEAKMQKNKESAALRKQMNNDIYKALQAEYGLTEKQSHIILEHVYATNDNIFIGDALHDAAEFAQKLMKCMDKPQSFVVETEAGFLMARADSGTPRCAGVCVLFSENGKDFREENFVASVHSAEYKDDYCVSVCTYEKGCTEPVAVTTFETGTVEVKGIDY